ncbi:MAG: hypothetical protein D6800_03805 [Candidatus Zixiibacteriota bacterium]|nr:MAG: hypothetical protein D6800_03805 [candidate division Zixibacteria bacterium]
MKISTPVLTYILLGVLSAFTFNVVGQLRMTDLILPALCVLFWAARGSLWLDRYDRNILLFGLLWLVGELFADFYRGSNFLDMLRGTASIVTFILQFSALYQLAAIFQKKAGPSNLVWLLYGAALGGLLMPILSPTPFSEMDSWKFGYGVPSAIILATLLRHMAVSPIRIRRHVATIAALAFGGMSMWLGFRSLGGAMVLASLVCEIRFTPLGRFLSRRKTGFRPLAFAVLAGVVAYIGLASAYGMLAESGWLGEKQKAKYEAQSAGEFGLLVGGRLDLIPAIMAIKDSPLIGYGSWAKNSSYRSYLLLANKFGYQYEEGTLQSVFERGYEIPAHSHILQAWLWAGIPGLVFWIYLAYLVARSSFAAYVSRSELLLPVVFLAIMALWDIAFSPFGSFLRYQWAMRLTLFLCVLGASSRTANRHRTREN